MSASEKALAALHAKLAEAYDRALDDAIQSGEIPATLLTSATGFLKTNGITLGDLEDQEESAAKQIRERLQGEGVMFPFDPEAPSH